MPTSTLNSNSPQGVLSSEEEDEEANRCVLGESVKPVSAADSTAEHAFESVMQTCAKKMRAVAEVQAEFELELRKVVKDAFAQKISGGSKAASAHSFAVSVGLQHVAQKVSSMKAKLPRRTARDVSLSEYELLRRENMNRNEDTLRQLGLSLLH